jgi:hypothetical protein
MQYFTDLEFANPSGVPTQVAAQMTATVAAYWPMRVSHS